MSEPKYKSYFKLSPELVDGCSCEIVERIDTPLMLERLQMWADEMRDEPGESVTITVVQMTSEEFERLPEL